MAKGNKHVLDDFRALLKALSSEDNPEVRDIISQDAEDKLSYAFKGDNFKDVQKERVDVIIFTVVEIEHTVLNEILKFDDGVKAPYDNINNKKIWKISIKRASGNDLNVLISQIGEAGPVKSSITCLRVFQKYDCDLALLIGIAAGNPQSISKYDVIVAEAVIDYEPQRLEPKNKIEYRSIPYMLRPTALLNFFKFNFITQTSQNRWRERFKMHFEELRLREPFKSKLSEYEDKMKLKMADELTSVKIKVGLVGSGNKLIADPQILPTLKMNIGVLRGIEAAEMEAAGFCPACEEYELKWIMFRGISDYGGKDKNTVNKKVQWVAALSAVTGALEYLSFDYKTPLDNISDF